MASCLIRRIAWILHLKKDKIFEDINPDPYVAPPLENSFQIRKILHDIWVHPSLKILSRVWTPHFSNTILYNAEYMQEEIF